MNNKELMEKISELEQELKDLKEAAKILEEPVAWTPENGEEYYFICGDVSIRAKYNFDESEYDKRSLCYGNCFKTKERAKQVAEKFIMLLQLERYHDMFCPDYIPDWDNPTELKFLVYYDNCNKTWEWDYMHFRRCCTEIYFDSEETAQKVCDLLNAR